ncbi:MAG: hypothetical protein BHW00_00500 [Clostridium sp. 26_22]|nr:MAG: hypothetical protein BHW00_00500 [Clostridium sp. 26_22]
MKNNLGITLVSLIVTVIILIILAGISIASLTGNGLFEKAKLAKEKQENAQIEENERLSDYESEIEKIYSNTREFEKSIQLDYSKSVDISSYTSENNKYTIPENGYLVVQYNEQNTTTTHWVYVYISDYPFVPRLVDNEWGVPENFSTIINKGQTVYFTYRYYNNNNELHAFFIPFK